MERHDLGERRCTRQRTEGKVGKWAFGVNDYIPMDSYYLCPPKQTYFTHFVSVSNPLDNSSNPMVNVHESQVSDLRHDWIISSTTGHHLCEHKIADSNGEDPKFWHCLTTSVSALTLICISRTENNEKATL